MKSSADIEGVVARNIAGLVARQKEMERRRGAQERAADSISAFAGSMPFVYLHLALFGAWITINLDLTPIPPFDPTFVVLAMFASVEAIFLSTFVLITQNRMQADADRRADLDLQISLLTEHEVTRLIQLVDVIAERLGVDKERGPELQELKRDVVPGKVLDQIEATQQSFDRTGK